MTADTVTKSSSRRGLFSRIRSRKKKKNNNNANNFSDEEEIAAAAVSPEKPQGRDDDEEDELPPTPPPTPPTPDNAAKPNEESYLYPQTAGLLTPALSKKNKLPIRHRVMLEAPPAAADAAFSGPPRYDWIDIETAAAIKVQSAYRRNKAMWELERQGVSTAAMRNRQRRRRALQQATPMSNLFSCCGVGLALLDDDEDPATRQVRQKQAFEAKRKQKEEREQSLIRGFFSKKKSAAANGDAEVFEVVE